MILGDLYSRINWRTQGLETAPCLSAKNQAKRKVLPDAKEEAPPDTDTRPAQSKKHTLKHNPNHNCKSASIYGKEKGFPLPDTVNSHPSSLLLRVQIQTHCAFFVFHKQESEIFDKKMEHKPLFKIQEYNNPEKMSAKTFFLYWSPQC